MKIGIVGLGNIGKKAFLPNYITMNDRVDWILFSRDEEKGLALKHQYNFKNVMSDFDLFLNSGLDAVMVHTPTHTHYEMIKTFLKHGIHVYADKPLSEKIDEVSELFNLAKENHCILFTGFNRRFAPHYQKLKAVSDKSMIIVQKNRASTKQEPRFAIFDMMSHVVDTALYLSDEAIMSYTIQTKVTDELLNHALITFKTLNSTIIAIMNMESGAHTERVEVMSRQGHYVVENMDSLQIQTSNSKEIQNFGDWTPTLDKRGFTQMVNAFIDTIVLNKNEFTDEKSVMLTHDILNEIYLNTLKQQKNNQ